MNIKRKIWKFSKIFEIINSVMVPHHSEKDINVNIMTFFVLIKLVLLIYSSLEAPKILFVNKN